MKKLPILFLLGLLPLCASADLVTEGEVTRLFTIDNLSEFADYEFYIRYQEYYYDKGYQRGEVREVPVESAEPRKAGDRDATSLLYARKRGEKEAFAESKISLGGREVISQRGADHIRDRYRIQSVEKGVVKLKLVARDIIMPNGREIKMKKSAFSSGYQIFGVDLLVVVFPVVCLLGIVAFFLFRRRKVAA